LRPPSPVRDPHARLISELEDPHLISVIRQDRRECLGKSILHRAVRAMVLRLYCKTLTANPDAVTSARLCGEAVRSMRALGMMRDSWGRAGTSRTAPPRRADIFTHPANDGHRAGTNDTEGGDDARTEP